MDELKRYEMNQIWVGDTTTWERYVRSSDGGFEIHYTASAALDSGRSRLRLYGIAQASGGSLMIKQMALVGLDLDISLMMAVKKL